MSSNEPASPPEPQETAGQILRSAREEAGLNRAQLGADLGLTEAAVRDLELSRFERLPGDIYIRGYLKNYAKRVDRDESDILARYLDETGGSAVASAVSHDAQETRLNLKVKLAIGVVIVVLLVIVMVVNN